MARFFNTAGPVDPADHYCLPPLSRVDLDRVESLIGQKKFFVLHAPRQTGKTTCLLALRDHLNRGSTFFCVYANLEVGQGAREDLEKGLSLVIREIAGRASSHGDTHAERIRIGMEAEASSVLSLTDFLYRWCPELSRPLVLLLDEIDSLMGDTLVTVLRHLRAGYDRRPGAFPQSVVLCGVRDVRDYRLRLDDGKAVIAGGSAFNVRAESLRLGDFLRGEVEELLGQHTAETGQRFESDALALIWDLTQGQPWLVNALAYECCFRNLAGRARDRSVTAAMVQEAKESLIERRETHLDQLADKLKETRVRRVVEALLAGSEAPRDIPADDIDYAVDLGLIRKSPSLELANPIYREIIPRELTRSTQETMVQEAAWYVAQDGRLDLDRLLSAFQEFFREHSEHWLERFDYKEAGPQLLLQAFLQRVVNGGGRIEREYGLGRGRTDLLVAWPCAGGTQMIAIELKILRKGLERTLAEGIEQALQYRERTGAPEAHLVLFDRDPAKPWSEKIFRRVVEAGGRTVVVWGM